MPEYSHFDGLVPVDDVSAEREGFDVDDVHVAALRAHVDPLRLQRQVEAGDPEDNRYISPNLFYELILIGRIYHKRSGDKGECPNLVTKLLTAEGLRRGLTKFTAGTLTYPPKHRSARLVSLTVTHPFSDRRLIDLADLR